MSGSEPKKFKQTFLFPLSSAHLPCSSSSSTSDFTSPTMCSVDVEPQTSSLNSDFDIGTINFKQSLSDSQKKVFTPSLKWQGSLKVMGDKQRRVPRSIFDQTVYPHVSYSIVLNSVFCTACSIFAKAKDSSSPFIRQTHNDWRNIEQHLKRHVSSVIHIHSVEAATCFLNIIHGVSDSIKHKLSKAYAEKIENNRNALKSIIKTLILCGRQNIAIRGKCDDRSNFCALLNYKAENDNSLKLHM